MIILPGNCEQNYILLIWKHLSYSPNLLDLELIIAQYTNINKVPSHLKDFHQHYINFSYLFWTVVQFIFSKIVTPWKFVPLLCSKHTTSTTRRNNYLHQDTSHSLFWYVVWLILYNTVISIKAFFFHNFYFYHESLFFCACVQCIFNQCIKLL
jgi:hypothetical protein